MYTIKIVAKNMWDLFDATLVTNNFKQSFKMHIAHDKSFKLEGFRVYDVTIKGIYEK